MKNIKYISYYLSLSLSLFENLFKVLPNLHHFVSDLTTHLSAKMDMRYDDTHFLFNYITMTIWQVEGREEATFKANGEGRAQY